LKLQGVWDETASTIATAPVSLSLPVSQIAKGWFGSNLYFGSQDKQVGLAIDTQQAYTLVATNECTSRGSSASSYDFKSSTTAVYNTNVKENLEI